VPSATPRCKDDRDDRRGDERSDEHGEAQHRHDAGNDRGDRGDHGDRDCERPKHHHSDND
jgi:hypothetical protein